MCLLPLLWPGLELCLECWSCIAVLAQASSNSICFHLNKHFSCSLCIWSMLRASTQFDVSKLTSSLENFGQALAALGLKSGGTVQQRAERLFLTKVCIANSASLFQ